MRLLEIKNYAMNESKKAVKCDVEATLTVLRTLRDVSVIDVSSSQEMKAILTLIKLKGNTNDSLIVFNKLKEFEDVEDDTVEYVILKDTACTLHKDMPEEQFEADKEVVVVGNEEETAIEESSVKNSNEDDIQEELLEGDITEDIKIEEDILVEDEAILPSEKYPGYFYKTTTREIMVNTGTCFEVYQPVTYE